MTRKKREKTEQKERLTLRQVLALTMRGFAVWYKASPQLLCAISVRTAVGALVPYVPLWFTARLINAIALGESAARVWQTLLLLLVCTALTGLANEAAHRWYVAVWNSRIWAEWHRILFEKLLAMDFCDIDDPKTQRLLDQLKGNNNYGMWGLSRLIDILDQGVSAIFRIGGALALSVSLFTTRVPSGSALAWLNSPVCIAGMALLMIGTILAAAALSNHASSYWARYDGARGNRECSFFQSIAMRENSRAADIRIYAQDVFIERGGILQRRGEASFGPHSSIGKAGLGPMGLSAAAARAISYLFTGAVYLYTGLKAIGGAFGIGSVTQYVGALAGLAGGFQGLMQAVGEMRNNAPFLQTTFEFLDIPNSMYQGSLTTEKRSDRDYEIEFCDVSFKYPASEVWALRHVSMKFRVGGRLAVVGENGSGKTTFIKLLCRLYDPTEGEILLNGIDIRKYRYDDYLALFSVVFQDFRLLSQPLGANVAAAQAYDSEKAKSCLERAGFGARLAELPKGLDTCLYRKFEDDGVEISGGEAQKIALARVLYQDAPFIVLDEPTAALDPEAEAEIYTKFNDIVEDKTAIYISHRLSSCRFCDEVAVFDSGRVVQQGTHDDLVEADGKYHDLWTAQAQYYTSAHPLQTSTHSA